MNEKRLALSWTCFDVRYSCTVYIGEIKVLTNDDKSLAEVVRFFIPCDIATIVFTYTLTQRTMKVKIQNIDVRNKHKILHIHNTK